MAYKDELHKLIDELPESMAGEVLDFVKFLRQKEGRRSRDAAVDALRAAPEDNEPDTCAERIETAEALADYRVNGGISAEEAKRRLL